MLTFTAIQARTQGARYLRAPILFVAAALLLVTSFSYGQAPAGPGGPPPGAEPPPGYGGSPGAGPPPGFGGPPGGGAPQAYDDGIPPPKGGREGVDGAPRLRGLKLSDKAPPPPSGPRDFEGVWYHASGLTSRIMRDIYGSRLAYTEEGKKTLKHRREMENAGTPLTNPASRCYPAVTWSLEIGAPFQIVQTDDLIYFVFQEFHSIWQIDMNPRRGAAGDRTFSGHSVGHWDGNTLVVDTTNFKEPAWLDTAGTPASKDLHLTHRIRKLEDGKGLEVLTIVNDPQMYAKPWSFARTYVWTPNSWMLGEYDCEVQVGDVGGGATNYGLTEDQKAPQ